MISLGLGLLAHPTLQSFRLWQSVDTLLVGLPRVIAWTMQETLQNLWKSGRQGYLSPLEQMRALAYRDIYLELGVPEWGLQTKVAGKLKKIGGGSPTAEGVRLLWQKVDGDPAWFPGKSYQEQHGPAPALNGSKRQCIGRSMMAYKA